MVLWEGSPGEDVTQLWDDALSNIIALQRRSIKQQSENLEKETISALHGITLTAVNYERFDLIHQALPAYAQVFDQEYSVEPQGSTVEFLLTRFEEVQNWIFSQFDQASDEASLAAITEVVDALLQTHATLWKTAIENEARGAMDYLHYLLDDVYQFRPYAYRDPLPPQESSDGEDEEGAFREQKQEQADTYREAIAQLRFVTYGWALNLYRDDDLSERFVDLIFGEYVASDFDTVSDLSAVYFQLVEEAGILTYWERWNMDRALDDTHGVATTGAAVNTWLLDFYCTALVWVLDSEEAIERLDDREVEQSPITQYEQVGHRVDDVIELLESYQSEYPLAATITAEPSVDERCDALIAYFERVKNLLDQQEQETIRSMPLDEELKDQFTEAVNSQLDACQLRTGIQEAGKITQVDALDEDDRTGFTLSAVMARRLFVDDGVPTTFASSFSDVLNRYRDFVIDELQLEDREIATIDDLPEALATVAAENDVAVFVVGADEASDILREDDRSELTPHSDIQSFYEFDSIPVLADATTDYVAVALFDDGFAYVEQEDHPLTVTVTPGEDVADWTADDAPEGKVPRDFVQVQIRYRARIQSTGLNGVVFRLAD